MTGLHAFLEGVSVWALPAILAITLHEAAHGIVAERLGDPTPRAAGRISLNPLKHIDPFGTVVLPGLLLALGGFVFGYAKPVPIDYRNLKSPKRDMAIVAAAGPLANFLIAVAAAFCFRFAAALDGRLGDWLGQNLVNLVLISVILGVFNLLPIPPLDGGRVLVGILPGGLSLKVARLERYGLGLVFLAIFIVPFVTAQLGHPFSPLSFVINPAVNAVLRLVMAVTGQS